VAGKSPLAAVVLLAALTGCSQSNVERSAAEAGKAPLGIAQAAGTTVASAFYVDLSALLMCEERAGRTDPYRRVAALIHVIAAQT
jgi:hypothetical protein